LRILAPHRRPEILRAFFRRHPRSLPHTRKPSPRPVRAALRPALRTIRPAEPMPPAPRLSSSRVSSGRRARRQERAGTTRRRIRHRSRRRRLRSLDLLPRPRRLSLRTVADAASAERVTVSPTEDRRLTTDDQRLITSSSANTSSQSTPPPRSSDPPSRSDESAPLSKAVRRRQDPTTRSPCESTSPVR